MGLHVGGRGEGRHERGTYDPATPPLSPLSLLRVLGKSGAATVLTLGLGMGPCLGLSLGPAQAQAVPNLVCRDALRAGQSDLVWKAVAAALRRGQRPAAIGDYRCFSPTDLKALAELTPVQGYRQLMANGFSSQVLYDALERELDRTIAIDRREGQRRRQHLAWAGAYLGEATVMAYRRSGERRFLDLFVRYFDRVLDRRDAVLGYRDAYYGRVMRGWGSVRADGENWINLITHNGRITYPATEFARLVASDPQLAAYRGAAKRYADASHAALADLDDTRQPVGNPKDRAFWFLRPPNGELEATNRIHLVGNSWLNLAELTGDPRYRERLQTLIRIFEQGVQREPDGSVHWNYFPYFAGREQQTNPYGREFSEPIWKGALTVPFLLRAQQRGYAVDGSLLEAIASTIDATVLGGDTILRNLSPIRSRPVDPVLDEGNLQELQAVYSLVDYGALRPAIIDKLKGLVGSRPDLFSGGWLGSPAGLMAYAYLLPPTAPNTNSLSHKTGGVIP